MKAELEFFEKGWGRLRELTAQLDELQPFITEQRANIQQEQERNKATLEHLLRLRQVWTERRCCLPRSLPLPFAPSLAYAPLPSSPSQLTIPAHHSSSSS